MVAPHERCSEQSAVGMLHAGFEALVNSNPRQWHEGSAAGDVLAGWHPADFVAGGLCTIPRHFFEHDREDLVLRAFLGHPLVLSGHHTDASEGLGSYADAVDAVRQCGGGPTWMSPQALARSNVAVRRRGDLLEVRAYAARFRVDVPDGVSKLRVEARHAQAPPLWRSITWSQALGEGTAHGDWRADTWRSQDIELASDGPVDVDLRPEARPVATMPPRRLSPVARRVLTEGRDRLAPLLRRVSAARGGPSRSTSRSDRTAPT
jgi:hypothetical protein